MDLPTPQHQEMGTHSAVDQKMMVCQNSKAAQEQMRKARPQAEQALKCPRCESTNTKFCYYNNYSLSQPRYFCKSCRRYWTQGGTLRNVPVGGGCRKNKRSSSTSSSKRPGQDHPPFPLPPLSYDHHTNDLTLAFARLHKNSNSNSCAPTFNDFDFSVFGMPNADDGGAFGYSSQPHPHPHPHGLYYGNDNNMNMGSGIEDSGGDPMMRVQPYDLDQDHHHHHNHEYTNNATTTAVTVTTMKQEIINNNETKTLWGYGYPNLHINNNADSNMMMALDFDSAARETSWNAFNNSNNASSCSWHALLNTPLM